MPRISDPGPARPVSARSYHSGIDPFVAAGEYVPCGGDSALLFCGEVRAGFRSDHDPPDSCRAPLQQRYCAAYKLAGHCGGNERTILDRQKVGPSKDGAADSEISEAPKHPKGTG